jgi:hypothetical protein
MGPSTGSSLVPPLRARMRPPRSFPSDTITTVRQNGPSSQALAQRTPHGVCDTYPARAEYHGVARSDPHDRAHGQRSKEKKDQS